MTPIPTELRELMERIAKPVLFRSQEDAHADACAELRALLATPPADAADIGGQAGEEVERFGQVTCNGLAYMERVAAGGYVRTKDFNRILAQHRQQAGKLVEALGLTVQALDQLLPFLSKVPADVGLINEALVAARPLLKK